VLGYCGAEGAEFGEGEIEGHGIYYCITFYHSFQITVINLMLSVMIWLLRSVPETISICVHLRLSAVFSRIFCFL